MNRVLPYTGVVFLIAGGLLLGSPPGFADELDISANTPEITVSTRSMPRNFVQLPALVYQLTVDHGCTSDTRPGAISLSVADTRVSFSPAETDRTGSRTISFTIPEDQLPPVRIEEYCLAGNPPGDNDATVRIPAVLSLQGSLRCEEETGNRITYTSTPLDVVISCQREAEAEPID